MLNMDFNQRVVINTLQQDWVASPMSGVWRKPLAREDVERGHATSIVRYDAGARFSAHDHPGGEEILVLEGTFSDESGDFKAGTYFRNPEGFRHAPYCNEGCMLFVKLHQFQHDDRNKVCIDTATADWVSGRGDVSVLPLHAFKGESVALVRLLAGQHFSTEMQLRGEEIYVISGEFVDPYGRYPAGSWMRSPQPSNQYPQVEVETLILIKTGHLE